MKTNKSFRFNAGYSLIESLIAIAVSGILLMSVLSVSSLSAKSKQITLAKNNRALLVHRTETDLLFRDQCRSSFKVGSANPVRVNLAQAQTFTGQQIALTFANLKAGANSLSNELQAGNNNDPDAGRLIGQRLEVNSLKLYSLLDMNVSPGPNLEVYRAYVDLAVNVRGSSAAGADMSLRSVPIASVMLTLDSSAGGDPIVSECYSTAFQSLKELCNLLGGEYRPLGTPPCRFRADVMTCPNGQVWTGVVGGVAQCSPIGGGCGVGQVVRGYGVNSVNCLTPQHADEL